MAQKHDLFLLLCSGFYLQQRMDLRFFIIFIQMLFPQRLIFFPQMKLALYSSFFCPDLFNDLSQIIHQLCSMQYLIFYPMVLTSLCISYRLFVCFIHKPAFPKYFLCNRSSKNIIEKVTILEEMLFSLKRKKNIQLYLKKNSETTKYVRET